MVFCCLCTSVLRCVLAICTAILICLIFKRQIVKIYTTHAHTVFWVIRVLIFVSIIHAKFDNIDVLPAHCNDFSIAVAVIPWKRLEKNADLLISFFLFFAPTNRTHKSKTRATKREAITQMFAPSPSFSLPLYNYRFMISPSSIDIIDWHKYTQAYAFDTRQFLD